MRILVLGKNGYVSRCFQEYMKEFSDTVDTISVRGNEWRNYSFSQYDTVFNATGLAHNDARKGTEEEFINLNVKLPFELAKKAKSDGVSQFVHMSSMIVYGSQTSLGKNEKYNKDTTPIPNNIYGRSKLMGEQELNKLLSSNFNVSIIRSPLIYGENAEDNFAKLVNFAKKLPIFPILKNERSMIYSDNLCELVRLIMENRLSGVFFPQQERYICTSEIVKDIAKAAGHHIFMTKLFNPALKVLSRKMSIINKAFGSEAYEMSMSNAFDGRYRIVSYEESIKKLTKANKG